MDKPKPLIVQILVVFFLAITKPKEFIELWRMADL